MGYQIIRSADSIAANIAEGYGRYSPADRKNFYRYARGSFEETKAWLRKAIQRKIISDYNGFRGGPTRPCKGGIFVASEPG